MSLALLAFLVLAAVQADTASPNKSELAKAVAEFTRTTISDNDIRHVACEPIEEEPTEAACEWQQKMEGRWQRYSTYVAVNADGWHLIDGPARTD